MVVPQIQNQQCDSLIHKEYHVTGALNPDLLAKLSLAQVATCYIDMNR